MYIYIYIPIYIYMTTMVKFVGTIDYRYEPFNSSHVWTSFSIYDYIIICNIRTTTTYCPMIIGYWSQCSYMIFAFYSPFSTESEGPWADACLAELTMMVRKDSQTKQSLGPVRSNKMVNTGYIWLRQSSTKMISKTMHLSVITFCYILRWVCWDGSSPFSDGPWDELFGEVGNHSH